MSYRTRNYVKGDAPMYRGVVVDTRHTFTTEDRTHYAGPYATVAPAKAFVNGWVKYQGVTGLVEVCEPTWRPLDESA